jgi:hypothetical protein
VVWSDDFDVLKKRFMVHYYSRSFPFQDDDVGWVSFISFLPSGVFLR